MEQQRIVNICKNERSKKIPPENKVLQTECILKINKRRPPKFKVFEINVGFKNVFFIRSKLCGCL